MTLEPAVEGPAWTGHGIQESTGRYPLRVESAVGNLVGRLCPAVITTPRHARMYAVHALGWAEAGQRGLDRQEGLALIRRMEVVAAAVHHLHTEHVVALSTAHGESALHRFLDEKSLDVEAAAALHSGLSRSGFAGVYTGPCIRLRALTDEPVPRPGTRADVAALRSALGGLIDLADQRSVSVADLRAADNLCLCQARHAPDGRWIRQLLAEEPERGSDRRRRLTSGLLLEALAAAPGRRPTDLFVRHWAFGAPYGDPESDDRAKVAAAWRAAALRNFSVGAWRALWRWLGEQLSADPMTLPELGERFADALDSSSVSALIGDLPDRMDGERVLPAELDVQAEDWTPMRAVRELALGAQRLQDLHGPTLKAFVGTDPTDLGPRWVDGLLVENAARSVRDIGRDLAEILVRRAQRVALSKMYLTREGRPFVPTRLRDRDGVLSLYGREGDGDVALRIDSLADVLAGAGYVDVDDDRRYRPSALGEDARGRFR